jgi:hypothetical protein
VTDAEGYTVTIDSRWITRIERRFGVLVVIPAAFALATVLGPAPAVGIAAGALALLAALTGTRRTHVAVTADGTTVWNSIAGISGRRVELGIAAVVDSGGWDWDEISVTSRVNSERGPAAANSRFVIAEWDWPTGEVNWDTRAIRLVESLQAEIWKRQSVDPSGE